MSIKLNKAQINALANEIVDSFNKQEQKKHKDSKDVILKDPKFIKYCNEQHSLINKINKNLINSYTRSDMTLKRITNYLLDEHSGVYKQKYIYTNEVTNKIILATIDATTLDELKKSVLKSL